MIIVEQIGENCLQISLDIIMITDELELNETIKDHKYLEGEL